LSSQLRVVSWSRKRTKTFCQSTKSLKKSTQKKNKKRKEKTWNAANSKQYSIVAVDERVAAL
jgi:hypothetical protein